MNRKKQLFINLISSGLAFIIQLSISFLLTPYITESIGIEAYGFISLGNNFINYASLITIALNSMAGRFITIELHRDNIKKANIYFTTVFIANALIAVLLVVPSLILIQNIDSLINIPPELVSHVKILFAFLFLNYLISLIFSVYSVATFTMNKLYLTSLRNIESQLLKTGLLVGLFYFFDPTVFFVSLATLVAQLYISYFNAHYTRKFLHSIKIRVEYFDYKALREVIASGIWNTINRLGQMMSSGFDLLLSNIFINSSSMGTLSVAKVLPNAMLLLIGMLSNVFMPDFTILYAKNMIDDLLFAVRRSIKILGIITAIPISVLISMGDVFFLLWIPSQNSIELQLLAIITILPLIISGPINSLYNIYSVTNKLKINAVSLLIAGVLNIIIVVYLLLTTDLGIIAIAGVSSIIDIIRNITITIPLSARYLNLKWNYFFKDIIRPIISLVITTLVGLTIKSLFVIEGWLIFLVIVSLIVIIGIVLCFCIILNKDERQYLLSIVRNRFI